MSGPENDESLSHLQSVILTFPGKTVCSSYAGGGLVIPFVERENGEDL